MAQGGAAPVDQGVTDTAPGSGGSGGNVAQPAAAAAAPKGGTVGQARARAVAAISAAGADAVKPVETPDPVSGDKSTKHDDDKTPPATPVAKQKEGEIQADPDLVARMAALSAENRKLREQLKTSTPAADVAAAAARMTKIEGLIKSGNRRGALAELQTSYQEITSEILASEPGSEANETAKAQESKLDELGKKIDAMAEEKKAEKEAEEKAAQAARAERVKTGLREVVTKDPKRWHYIGKPSQFERALDAALTHARTKGGEMREALGRGLSDQEAEKLVMEGFDAHEKALRADFGEPGATAATPAPSGGIGSDIGTGLRREPAEIQYTDARTAKRRAQEAILRASGG